jgi:putative transposase
VGWTLAQAENAETAKVLVAEAVAHQGVERSQLYIHMDRGSPMTAKPFVFFLADLGLTKSYSRPRTSNDNPYSESQFRTMKYRPDYPDRFGSFEDALSWCRRFFPWYCDEHRHSGIGYHTPADVHYGRAEFVRQQRGLVLEAAYAAHPERFVRRPPVPPALPTAVWINKPEEVSPSAQ